MTRLATLKHAGLHRPRLLAAACAGMVVWLLLPQSWNVVTRALVAWNVAVWPYVASMGWLMLRAAPARVRAIAEQENASSAALVGVMCTAAVLSIVAIVAELALAGAGGHSLLFGFALPILTVSGSWFLVGVIYTFHYAHMYYETAKGAARPLRFPEGLESPTYVDFLYFAVTIGTAFSVSDVLVTNSRMRWHVMVHSAMSFFYNAAVVAFALSLFAGR